MRRNQVGGLLAASVVCCAAVLGFSASAIGAESAPPPFTQIPKDGAPGAGEGSLDQPLGLAVSPANHYLYVSDTRNRRVSVFTAWGEFKRVFGTPGEGPGQFGEVPAKSQLVGPTGIAADSNGYLYVMDLGNYRVQKFDPEGNFLLTFGGKVNGTTEGNVCTAAEENCVAGKPGSGDGEFSIENATGTNGAYVAVGPGDLIYVGDKDRIQAFSAGGVFEGSIPLPEAGNPGALAADPVSGDLYFAFNQISGMSNSPSAQPGVYRLNASTGEQVGPKLPIERPAALATDSSGNLYVASDPATDLSGERARIVKFDPDGNLQVEFGELETGVMPALATGQVGEATNDVDIYSSADRFGVVSAVNVFGVVPDPGVVGPPPLVAPQIPAQFAASVGSTSAVLRAEINPQFWADTTYQVEVGGVDCKVGPCADVLGSPALLTTKVTNFRVLSDGVALEGLTPNTTYHYRFVAQSTGGGPEYGADRTFTTPPLPAPPVVDCPNQGFRSGLGAFLADCRAYEMVSPVDKLGSDVVPLPNIGNIPAGLDKSALDGGKLTYSAYKAYGEAISSPYTSQYLTTRVAGSGWAGHSISPPRSGPTLLELSGLESQFKLFSEDLCEAWFLQDTALSLAPQAVADYPNLYKASPCATAAGYEAITRVQPPARPANEYLFEVQGQGGGHTVFRANDKLTASAPAGEAGKVYDFFEGALKAVCILPNGSAVGGGCSVGTADGAVPVSERKGRVESAVSEDGERIYWTADNSGQGKLYLRSATSATSATSAVSKGAARFWGAAADGSRAVFSEGTDLYEFQPGIDAPGGGTLIAGGVKGVVEMSEDASRVYLVSEEELDGGAKAGEPNLYLAEGGGIRFIATLSDVDVDASNKFPSAVEPQPTLHLARVTDDGETLAFNSNNGLTGEEKLDVNSGKADSQVYLYQAGSETLRCVSCSSTGARPTGRDIVGGLNEFWAAALLAGWTNQLYAPRALSENGKRVFFTSFDALVARDTNGVADVYEWEAQGEGECTRPEGCTSLISGGESPEDSEFVDASADGTDVFFKTQASLVSQDPGLIDIYDARVGGGFPEPPPPLEECQGEACQNPAGPPNDPTPSSAQFFGPGNPVLAKKGAKSCAKGKHKVKRKGKVRCVSKRHKKSQKANKKRHKSKRAGKAKHNNRKEGRR